MEMLSPKAVFELCCSLGTAGSKNNWIVRINAAVRERLLFERDNCTAGIKGEKITSVLLLLRDSPFNNQTLNPK